MTETREKKVDTYKPEYLGVVWIGNVIHAMYETALRPLCLSDQPQSIWLAINKHGSEPTITPECEECCRVVSEWVAVEFPEQLTGIPKSWRLHFGRISDAY